MTDTTIWDQIRAAGPLADAGTFDPYLTQDVLAAERSMMQYERRKAFVASYAWAVPSPEAVDLIAAAVGGGSLLEVCAGSGLWAKLLADAGLRVTPTDLGPPPYVHCTIEEIEAEAAVLEHPECDALFVCWPPMKSDCAFRALRAFAGDIFIYAGDTRFTGDQQLAAAVAHDWVRQSQLPLVSWPGTADALQVFRRKPSHP